MHGEIMTEFKDSEGWFNYQRFYDYVSEQNFKVLVEVGVWKGSSISYLASKNVQSKIYAVDLFQETYRYKKGKLKQEASKINLTYNENLVRTNTRDLITDIKCYSWDGASHFDDNSIDFVFIDADHSYEAVKKDLAAWYPKLKSGGLFSGHDYEPYEKHSHPGVKKAVDEFAENLAIDVKQQEGTVWYFYKP
jgi:predicted O-methyltransferase YrrM